MLDLARRLLAALGSAGEDPGALEALLAEDVRAAGALLRGKGRAAVVAAAAAQPMLKGILAAARFSDPAREADRVTLRAELPPGLLISGLRLHLSIAGDRITELIQEVELAPPPPPTPLRIEGPIAAAIDGALASGNPMLVAYVDAAGAPHISFRGTLQSHGPDEVALWVRDPNGGLLKGIARNPHVALLYRDMKTRTQYELAGRARRVDDSAVRAQIFERSPEFEQGLDPLRRGVAVVVEIDKLSGGPPGQAVNMARDTAARSSAT
jgi:hypothetical protein